MESVIGGGEGLDSDEMGRWRLRSYAHKVFDDCPGNGGASLHLFFNFNAVFGL